MKHNAKHIMTNDTQMEPPKAIGEQGRRAQTVGKRRGVPPETPSQDSLLQVIIITQTNIRQETKKQSPENLWLQFARTLRASRHGADLSI